MASKKRGLSLEEKRQRMLDLFYTKKDFFLLKELEKIAPKEKGIVAQSVKDVVQSLVDDDLVDTDKIGTSVYFWSFPSKATQNRKRKMGQVDERMEETEKKAKKAREEMTRQTEGREDNEERQKGSGERTN
jgi:Fe2+ or Zn2+ uptake regulation protein